MNHKTPDGKQVTEDSSPVPSEIVISAAGDGGGNGITLEVTKWEVELLCEYWAKRLLYTDWVWDACGGAECKLRLNASARLHDFSDALGREKVDAIIAEVYKDYDPEKVREEYEAFVAEQQESLRDKPSPEECGEDLAIPPNDERASLERRSGATSEYRIEGTKAIPNKRGGNNDGLRF